MLSHHLSADSLACLQLTHPTKILDKLLSFPSCWRRPPEKPCSFSSPRLDKGTPDLPLAPSGWFGRYYMVTDTTSFRHKTYTFLNILTKAAFHSLQPPSIWYVMSNCHCTWFHFKLCTECTYTIENKIQFTIRLSCAAPTFLLPCSSPPRQWPQQFVGIFSAWKSPRCKGHSHPRKSRVTRMSCSLCTMVNRVHIESQITMHATTTYGVYAQEGQHVHDELVTVTPLNILISVLYFPIVKT